MLISSCLRGFIEKLLSNFKLSVKFNPPRYFRGRNENSWQASPHLEHILILSYPYMDMLASMKFLNDGSKLSLARPRPNPVAAARRSRPK